MLGVTCRLHDASGDDRGIAHLPAPIAVGDVAVEGGEYRVVDVVEVPPAGVIEALVKVRPTRLLVVAS
jgi:hypothetical protein